MDSFIGYGHIENFRRVLEQYPVRNDTSEPVPLSSSPDLKDATTTHQRPNLHGWGGVIGDLKDVVATQKAKMNDVLVVDLMRSGYPTVVISAKKDEAKLQSELQDALGASHLGFDSASHQRLHLHDWGGVIGLVENSMIPRPKLSTSAKTDEHMVFSFTPWNPAGRGKMLGMAQLAFDAGMRAMIVMTTKTRECGKASTFGALRLALLGRPISYYEDTSGVLEQCAAVEATMQTLEQTGHVEFYHVPNAEFPVSLEEQARMTANGITCGTRGGYLSRTWSGEPAMYQRHMAQSRRAEAEDKEEE